MNCVHCDREVNYKYPFMDNVVCGSCMRHYTVDPSVKKLLYYYSVQTLVGYSWVFLSSMLNDDAIGCYEYQVQAEAVATSAHFNCKVPCRVMAHRSGDKETFVEVLYVNGDAYCVVQEKQ